MVSERFYLFENKYSIQLLLKLPNLKPVSWFLLN